MSYLTTSANAGPIALSRDGGVVAVPAAAGSTMDLVSTVDGSTFDTVSLDGIAAAIVAAAPLTLDEEAFVAEEANSAVAMIDVNTGVLDQTVSVGSDPVAVAVSPNGQYAYVANSGGNTVSVLQTDNLDTVNSVVVATVSVGSDPVALALTPDGDRLLVVDQGTAEISVIDTNPNDGASYLTVVCDDLSRRQRHLQLVDAAGCHRLLARRQLCLCDRRR